MSIKKIFRKEGLVNSALWYTVGTFLLKGINFFTMPIFTHMLLPEEYSVVTLYATWSAMLAIFIGLGINGTVASAKANLEDKEYREYLSSTLFLGTISFLVCLIGAIVFRDGLAALLELPAQLMVILTIQSFFSFVINFATATYTFDKQPKKYLGVSFIVTIINLVLSVSLVLSLKSDKFYGKILGEAIATILVGVILYIKTMSKGKVLFSLKYWKFCLPIAIPLILHNASHLVLNQADKVMLSKVSTSTELGIYGALYTIGAMINILQTALNSAWVAWYFDRLKEKNIAEIKDKAKWYILVFTSITAMFILGVPELIKIFTSKAYWPGIPLLPIIIMGYYFVFLYTFPVNYEFYIKESRYIAVGTMLAAAINIVINYFLIPKMGMYAAAISTLVAYIVLFVLHVIIVEFKFKHRDIPYKFYLIPILALIAVIVVFYIFINNFIVRWGLILAYIVGIGIILWKSRKTLKMMIQ